MKFKKPTRMERIQNKFYRDEDGEIEIMYYGQYKDGLTSEEIKDYLRARANKFAVAKLYKKFCEIAGRNTITSYHCPCCDYNTSLMYRHDIQRFADVLFGLTKSTYFD